MNSEFLFKAKIDSLLNKEGIKDDFKIVPIHGGRNNRIFRIDVGNAHFCLKSYFNNPDDPRDRLENEFGFLDFAWQMGIRIVPEPLAMDKENNLGLYEFINGRKFRSQDVTEKRMDEALNLFRSLNNHKNNIKAKKLPNGSEACFSLSDHLKLVDYRVNRLLNIEHSSSINHKAIEFIRNELSPLWEKIFISVHRDIQKLGFPPNKQLIRMDRCLSPSDFGFHNTILEANGRLRFIDFEYAGWDDPAKMVCDFFCQPDIPVPLKYFDMFVQVAAIDLNEPERQINRFKVLLPVYQIKWCCIMLNDFLPIDAKRRRFANDSIDLNKQKNRQLQKARKIFQKVCISKQVFS